MGLSGWFKVGYDVLRPVVTNDGGIMKKTYSNIMSISGRFRPLRGTEILANEKLGLKTTDRFYCDVVDIRNEDVIYDENNSKYYEVKWPKNPMEMDHHLEIDCEYNPDLQNIETEASS